MNKKGAIILKPELDREKLLPLNIIRTGFKEHQYHVIRDEGYAAYQISVCVGGEGKFVYRNNEHTIGENDIFMFSPRTAHEYYPVSKKWQLYFFVFSGDAVENIFKYFKFEECGVFHAGENKKRIIELCRMLDETRDDYLTSLYLYELLGIIAMLGRSNPTAALSEEHFNRIAPVVDYIRKNYKQPIILDELAEIINVSKSYLCRIFKEMYGMTPIKYLQSFRIKRAKKLLRSTDIKLRLLCKEVGFNDTSYFCLIFREHEGMTPEEYRNLHSD